MGDRVSTADRFLEQFFQPPNGILWDSVNTGDSEAAKRIRPWLQRVRSGRFPAALPKVIELGGGRRATIWYVFAESARQLRLARDEAQAFVGFNYARVESRGSGHQTVDELDELVEDRFDHWFRIAVKDRPGVGFHACASHVRRRIELWLELTSQRPVSESTEVRPVGQLLGQFDEQLRTGLFADATDTLRAIEARGQLDQTALAGLSVLISHAKGESGRLLANLPADFLQRRLPRRVAQAILAAAHDQHIPVGCDPQEFALAFQVEVRPRFAPLLGSSVGITEPGALSLLLAAAALSPAPDLSVVARRAASAVEAGVDPVLVETLKAQAESADPAHDESATDPMAAAEQLYGQYELDAAWSKCLQGSTSPRQLQLLIRIALEVDSARRLKLVSERVHEAGSEALSSVGEVLLQRFKKRREELVGPTESIPQTWLEWVQLLKDPGEAKRAPELARTLGGEWRWPTGPARELREFAQTIEHIPGASRGRLIGSLGPLVDMLPSQPGLRQEVGAVCLELANHVLLDSEPRPGLFVTLADLLDRWFEAGIDPGDYVDLLDVIDHRIDSDGAASNTDELLALFDRLTFYPSPDRSRLQGLASSFLGRLRGWTRHLDDVQLELAVALCGDFGVPANNLADQLEELSKSEEVDRAWAHLDGRKIGIYSLDESSLRRAKAFLETHVSDIDVVISSAKASTAPLVSAARECEPFVVTSRAAKHAATDAIRANHPQVPLYSEGKGTASILRALREWRSNTNAQAA